MLYTVIADPRPTGSKSSFWRSGRFCLAAALLLVAAGASAGAQEKPASPSPPSYSLPQYEEDWTFLSKSSAEKDSWDPLKFIPLSDDKSAFVSLGGEIRETYERFHNTNFGLSLQDSNGYLLQRYLLHADFHGGPRFRFFGELSSSLENGRTGGPRRVVDENKLDVHQGFFDFALLTPSPGGSTLLVRIGRQEMTYGSGRLVALREGANVPLSFDGIRVSLHSTGWQLDGFATRPVQNNSGVLDDPPQHDFGFWGVYGSHTLRSGKATPNLDLYYLGVNRKHVVYNQGAGQEERHTLGARFWGQHKAVSYDAEAMYQFGEFNSTTITAWRVAADSAYTFSTLRWHPRIGLAADVASGDRNSGNPDLQTFYAMFQSGSYSGRAQILGPSNTVRLESSIGLVFSERLTFSGGWGFYWRESVNDGLYGIAGNLIVPSNGVKSRYEGSRPIAQADWQFTRHLSAHVNYIYVFNAQFEEQSVHGTKNMSFISPWITYRF